MDIEGEGRAVRQQRQQRDDEGEGGASGSDNEGRRETIGDVEGHEDVRWRTPWSHGTRVLAREETGGQHK